MSAWLWLCKSACEPAFVCVCVFFGSVSSNYWIWYSFSFNSKMMDGHSDSMRAHTRPKHTNNHTKDFLFRICCCPDSVHVRILTYCQIHINHSIGRHSRCTGKSKGKYMIKRAMLHEILSSFIAGNGGERIGFGKLANTERVRRCRAMTLTIYVIMVHVNWNSFAALAPNCALDALALVFHLIFWFFLFWRWECINECRPRAFVSHAKSVVGSWHSGKSENANRMNALLCHIRNRSNERSMVFQKRGSCAAQLQYIRFPWRFVSLENKIELNDSLNRKMKMKKLLLFVQMKNERRNRTQITWKDRIQMQ